MDIIDVLKEIDPKLAKLIDTMRKLKQAKDHAEKLKIACEEGLITDNDICEVVDKVRMLPPKDQINAIKMALLRKVFSSIRR